MHLLEWAMLPAVTAVSRMIAARVELEYGATKKIAMMAGHGLRRHDEELELGSSSPRERTLEN